MNTAERLNIIRQRAELNRQTEMNETAEKERELNELVSKVKELRPRIKDILELANACRNNGISIPDKGYYDRNYASGKQYGYPFEFIAEGICHHTGLIRTSLNEDMKYIGIENGGYCGKYDFYTDGESVFSRNEDSPHDSKEPRICDLKQFLEEFPLFERAFLKWIDSLR